MKIGCTGSERVKASGAVGTTLQEACAINASLSALGRVVMRLGKAAQRGLLPAHIPYRDSLMTRILQVESRPPSPPLLWEIL